MCLSGASDRLVVISPVIMCILDSREIFGVERHVVMSMLYVGVVYG